MNDGHLRPRTWRDLVYQHLLDQLANGPLSPRDQIDANAIAEELGVSRTPVREALALLEANGLIAVDARCGAVVVDPPLQEIEDDPFLLAVEESAVAKLAVEGVGTESLARLEGLEPPTC